MPTAKKSRKKDDRNTRRRLEETTRLYNEPNSVEIKRSLSSSTVGSNHAISLSLSIYTEERTA